MSTSTIRAKLGDLNPHPLQVELVEELPSQALRELARRMQGADAPVAVEVLPDHRTVIAGYELVRAARQELGWEEIDAHVREDLARRGPTAVEARVIEQALPIIARTDLRSFARIWLRLKELGTGLHRDQYEALRKRITEIAHRSERSLDRLARVLRSTPPPVQEAFWERRLPLALAEAVAGAAWTTQEQIARDIAAGGDPKDVVLAHLPAAPGVAARPTENILNRLLKNLPGVLGALEGQADGIRVSAEYRPVLERSAELLKRLGEQAVEEAELDAEMAQLVEKVLTGVDEEMTDEEGE